MNSPRAFLPQGALEDGTLARALDEIVSSWAQHWFVENKPIETRQSYAPEMTQLALPALVNTNRSLMIVIDDANAVALASALLGAPIGWPKLRNGDKGFACDLAGHALGELLQRLARRCHQPRDHKMLQRPPATPWTLRLSVARGTLGFDIYLSLDATILARRGPMAPARPLARHAREEALSRQPLNLSVMLGRSRLRLAELSTIAAGDVLILDRGPDDAVDLAVGNRSTADFNGAIERRDGGLHLRLLQTPNG